MCSLVHSSPSSGDNPVQYVRGPNSQVVEKYMREIYGERRSGGVWGWVVAVSTGGGLETREGAMPLPEKCKLHAEKVKFGAYFVYFCYLNMK